MAELFPAGNIADLDRSAYDDGSFGPAMDDLKYHYDDGAGGTYYYDESSNLYVTSMGSNALPPLDATNRLNHVDDAVVAVNPAWNDLGDQASNNYQYDEIGQLTRDTYEDLDIEWNACLKTLPIRRLSIVHKNGTTSGAVTDITYGYDAIPFHEDAVPFHADAVPFHEDTVQRRTSKKVEHYGTSDYEKTYYIYDAQGNVMAVYTENSVSSVVTTRQEELPIYGSDRLGLVRRNLELGDQNACPFCPTGAAIEPGMLRIVEVMYDSPLSNPTETHEGEFIVLRNATGITIPLESVTLAYPGGLRTFSSGDKLGPYQWAVVPRLSGSSQSGFASLYGLAGYDTDHDVNWFWDNSLTLPDPASRGRGAGGTVRIFDYTGGVLTVLDEMEFDGGSGITASNGSYCASSCSSAQTAQLDNFLTSPPGAFDLAEWSSSNVSGYGQQGMAAFVLDNSNKRELGGKEYELKDHLGNVRVVVSDIKHSDASSGTPVDFMADVLVMRDYYPFGMEMPGAVYQGDYRYGFNGMERDDQVKGEGMSYTAMFWEFDPRSCVRWNTDPKPVSSISEYACFEGNPILYNDPLGDKVRKEKNEDVTGKEFKKFKQNIRQMRRASTSFNTMYKDMRSDKVRNFTFNATSSSDEGATSEDEVGNVTMNIGVRAGFEGNIGLIAHETGHGYRFYYLLVPQDPRMPMDYLIGGQKTSSTGGRRYVTEHVENHRTEEIVTEHVENIVRSELINSGEMRYAKLDFSYAYYTMPVVRTATNTLTRVKTYTIGSELYRSMHRINGPTYYKSTQFDIRREIINTNADGVPK